MKHLLQFPPRALPSGVPSAAYRPVMHRGAPGGLAGLALAAGLALSCSAHATLVAHQAVSATVVSGGTLAGSNIANSYNQSGLLTPYSSGSTPWLPYVSSTLHQSASAGEWFAAPTAAIPATASVTYDLGILATVQGLALWNEDLGGASIVSASFGDANGVFSGVIPSLALTDNPFGSAPYGANLMTFASPTGTRYVNLKLSGCSQNLPQVPGYDGCSMGEVVFGVDDSSIRPVPEPASLALVGIALTAWGAGLHGRRHRDQRADRTAGNDDSMGDASNTLDCRPRAQITQTNPGDPA